MLKITLKQVESFLAVAESGSFSNAARHLHVAQPALSQAVKDLEAELGIRLFDRTTRKVMLTEAGRELRASAGRVITDLDHALADARDLATRRRGRIRIAAAPLLAEIVLPHTIAEFRGRYPGIAIELVDVSPREIVEAVKAGRVDCGLGTFLAGGQNIERSVLAHDQLMLFCHPDSQLRGVDTVRWHDLAAAPLITLTRDSGIRLLVEIGFEQAQLPVRPAYEVSLIQTALALVEAGLGISVLPTYAMAAAPHRRVLGKVLTHPTITRDIVLIHDAGRSTSPAVAAFSAVLRSHVQRLKLAAAGAVQAG